LNFISPVNPPESGPHLFLKIEEVLAKIRRIDVQWARSQNNYPMKAAISIGRASLVAAAYLWAAPISAFADKKETLPALSGLSLEELYNMETIQLNVLGAHTHPQGQFMVGYHYMFMQMEDYRDGTRGLSPEEVLSGYGYPTVHERMRMEMHMLEGMYAITDQITVMAMVPYKAMAMDHLTAMGHRFTQHTDGLGDGPLYLSRFRGQRIPARPERGPVLAHRQHRLARSSRRKCGSGQSPA